MDPDEPDLESYWKDVRVPAPGKWYEGARTKDGGTIVVVCRQHAPKLIVYS